ncbi:MULTISPECIES: hypothetical protein [unclassified Legionella]|uniref:hypothetical protein n=1 Tax=unclassified Legionella TaxID=2622702 RepID=UPI0010541D67|nr:MULTISPECIES: hypothetical protein [unclassified Legionella]MDI9818195.1 hypothetical protein [Legionella sp. PL877]
MKEEKKQSTDRELKNLPVLFFMEMHHDPATPSFIKKLLPQLKSTGYQAFLDADDENLQKNCEAFDQQMKNISGGIVVRHRIELILDLQKILFGKFSKDYASNKFCFIYLYSGPPLIPLEETIRAGERVFPLGIIPINVLSKEEAEVFDIIFTEIKQRQNTLSMLSAFNVNKNVLNNKPSSMSLSSHSAKGIYSSNNNNFFPRKNNDQLSLNNNNNNALIPPVSNSNNLSINPPVEYTGMMGKMQKLVKSNPEQVSSIFERGVFDGDFTNKDLCYFALSNVGVAKTILQRPQLANKLRLEDLIKLIKTYPHLSYLTIANLDSSSILELADRDPEAANAILKSAVQSNKLTESLGYNAALVELAKLHNQTALFLLNDSELSDVLTEDNIIDIATKRPAIITDIMSNEKIRIKIGEEAELILTQLFSLQSEQQPDTTVSPRF